MTTKLQILEILDLPISQSLTSIKDDIDYFQKCKDEKTIDEWGENHLVFLNDLYPNIIHTLKDNNISEEEYNLYVELAELQRAYHRNDTVIFGCDCGCGGDFLDYEYEENYDKEIESQIKDIESKLNQPV